MKTSVLFCIGVDGDLLNSVPLSETAFAQVKQLPLYVSHWPHGQTLEHSIWRRTGFIREKYF